MVPSIRINIAIVLATCATASWNVSWNSTGNISGTLTTAPSCPVQGSVWKWTSNPRITFGDHVLVSASLVNCTPTWTGSLKLWLSITVEDENFLWDDCPDDSFEIHPDSSMTSAGFDLFKNKTIGLGGNCWLRHIRDETHFAPFAAAVGNLYTIRYNAPDLSMGLNLVGIPLAVELRHANTTSAQLGAFREAAKEARQAFLQPGGAARHWFVVVLGVAAACICLCCCLLCALFLTRRLKASNRGLEFSGNTVEECRYEDDDNWESRSSNGTFTALHDSRYMWCSQPDEDYEVGGFETEVVE